MGFAPLLPAHPRPFGVTFWGQLFWITLLESPFWDHPFGVTHPTVTLRGHPFGVTHPTVTQRELPLPTPPGAVPCRPLPGKLFTRLSQPQSTAQLGSAWQPAASRGPELVPPGPCAPAGAARTPGTPGTHRPPPAAARAPAPRGAALATALLAPCSVPSRAEPSRCAPAPLRRGARGGEWLGVAPHGSARLGSVSRAPPPAPGVGPARHGTAPPSPAAAAHRAGFKAGGG